MHHEDHAPYEGRAPCRVVRHVGSCAIQDYQGNMPWHHPPTPIFHHPLRRPTRATECLSPARRRRRREAAAEAGERVRRALERREHAHQ
eukprot:4967776-Prymnesium_polylepis.2